MKQKQCFGNFLPILLKSNGSTDLGNILQNDFMYVKCL